MGILFANHLDGSVLFVADLWGLNQWLVHNLCPVPKNLHVNETKGFTYATALVLNSGYYILSS